jgi:hypothetical protein
MTVELIQNNKHEYEWISCTYTGVRQSTTLYRHKMSGRAVFIVRDDEEHVVIWLAKETTDALKAHF